MTAGLDTIAGEFCALLDELGVGDYRPAGLGGDVFLLTLPAEPDAAMRVAPYGGPEADMRHGLDEPRLQVWIRGGRGDKAGALRTAQRVYDQCHGLYERALPGGTWLEHALCDHGGPIYVGPDEHGRHEFTVNFRVGLDRTTRNRD